MKIPLSAQEFYLLQKYVQDYCGISLPPGKAYFLESRLSRIMHEYELKSFSRLYQMLQQGRQKRELAEKVIDALTVKETYWFRDKTPWVILDEVILPEVVAALRRDSSQRVRIWSAACSTGQEPYSILMCIEQHLERHRVSDVGLEQFEILATDISPTALQTAQAGRYDQLTISRGLDEHFLGRYFRQQGRYWTIKPELRSHVNFQQYNLRSSFKRLGRFDLIFCRYITIYFLEELGRELLQKMAEALTPGGILMLGNSEIYADHKASFHKVDYKGGVYYRKK